MKKLIAIFLMLLLLSATSYAGTEEYEFAKDYISVLGHRMIVAEKANNVPKQDDETAQIIEEMTFFRIANAEYETAQNIMKKWVNSINEIIKRTADMVYKINAGYIKSNNDALQIMEKTYSPEVMKNPENFDVGKMMSAISQMNATTTTMDKLLMNCSVLVTHLLVDQTPDKDGHLSYLNITSEQRKALMNDLEIEFGDSVKNGMQTGQSYIFASGASLYGFLAGEHKSADER